MGSLTSLDADFGNYSAAACFGLPFSDAVSCHAQHLNVSDPPRQAAIAGRCRCRLAGALSSPPPALLASVRLS